MPTSKIKSNDLPTYFQEYLDGRFQGVEDKIDGLKTQINKLDFTTNPEHINLVSRVEVLEIKVDNLEKWRTYLIGAWAVVVFVFIIFGFALKQFAIDVVKVVYKK